jgi:hypothetical protein
MIHVLERKIVREEEFSEMSQSQKSPLARLVLFMVCLAIAGSFVAGMHYFAIDLPQQKTLQAPKNTDGYACGICVKYCIMGGLPGDKCTKEVCRGSCT